MTRRTRRFASTGVAFAVVGVIILPLDATVGALVMFLGALLVVGAVCVAVALASIPALRADQLTREARRQQHQIGGVTGEEAWIRAILNNSSPAARWQDKERP